jgi:hypothetical protein
MTITTITIAGTPYISYASVAEAQAYLAVDATKFPTWSALTTDQKGAALIAATRRIDLFSFTGEKTSPSQYNEFPRTGSDYTDPNQVPLKVEQATISLAGSIAINPNAGGTAPTGSNIKKVKAGSAEVEYFKSTAGGPLSDNTAFLLLQDYLDPAMAGGPSVGGFASVDHCPSQFDEKYQGFTTNRGIL